MKSIYFITAILIGTLFTSCTLEDSLTVAAVGLDSIECEGCAPVGNETDLEFESLQEKWTSSDYDFFYNPIQYGDNIIFFNQYLRSINKYTGIENWTLDLGYISNFIEPILIDEMLYFIDNSTIYAINLAEGVKTVEQKWISAEYLNRGFNISDGIMYVNVGKTGNKYAAFASCPLVDLQSRIWTYLNIKNVPNNSTSTSIQYQATQVGKNEAGESIIYYISRTHNNETAALKIEAYNIATQKKDWVMDDGENSLSPDELLLKGDQLFVRGINYISSINKETGNSIWKQFTSAHEYNTTKSKTMILNDDILLLINGDEIITAFDNQSGQLIWKLNDSSIFVQKETGLQKGSFNVTGNTLFYLSNWGHIMEVDLDAGSYIMYHNSLSFVGGLIALDNGDLIAKPQFGGKLFSFSL